MAKKKKDDKKGKRKTFKKKEKRTILSGIAHIQATFNNTHVTISDMEGNVVAWASAGWARLQRFAQGYPVCGAAGGEPGRPGRRKRWVARSLDVRVKGPGSGRESAIRALQAAGITVKSIRDVTPIPHNGCRPPKRRRV